MQMFTVSTGVFIYNYLLEHEEAYVSQIYRAFKEEKKSLTGWRNRPLKTGSYQSFRNYIWWLHKLGLIEFSREETSTNPVLQPKRYYKLTGKGRKNQYLFFNPRRELYPESYEKHLSLDPKGSKLSAASHQLE